MDPGQQVASTAELIDKIYSYLDLKTVVHARVVCRKWRSVSDLYLKRRMSVRDWRERHKPDKVLTVAVYPDVQKASNLLNNNAFQVPHQIRPRKLTLTTWDSKSSKDDSRRGPKWRHSSAPFVAIVLDQDWTSNINSLKLHLCLTLNDLLAVQVAILKRFSSTRLIYVKLLQDRSAVVPLGYTEIQKKSGGEDFQNYSLKRFEVRGWLWSFKRKKAKSLDALVYDLFATCPNLDTFKFGLFQFRDDDDLYGHGSEVEPDSFFRSDMWAEGDWIATDLDFTITRSNHPNRVRDAMQVKPYWTARLIVCHRNLGPALSSLMSAILSLTQLQKLWIPLKYNVLEKVYRRTNWLQDRLDVLYLTSGYYCAVALRALDSTTVFANVTRLYWSIAMDSTTFNLGFTVGDSPIFPSVVTLQLHRNRDNSYAEPEGGFESDVWISRNIHKMAPNVRRLIVDVFNGEEADELRSFCTPHLYVSPKDIPLVLGIVKDFEKLEHLVLVNPTGYGRKWTDFSPENAAECLKGLKSMTLSIDCHEMLVEAAKYFLRVCQQESLGSITKMGLYNRNRKEYESSDDEEDSDDEDEDQVFAELRRAGVAIPEHMIVTTGTWTREMAREAFEGPLKY